MRRNDQIMMGVLHVGKTLSQNPRSAIIDI
jgi:hypothetical protein